MDSKKDTDRDFGSSDCSSADCGAEEKHCAGGRKLFRLIIGPIETDLDGFTAEDRKESLEDAGGQNVRIDWL